MSISPTPKKTTLVFGSQALTFDQKSFHQLRADVNSSPRLSWISQCVSQLADDFESLCIELPQLCSVDGRKTLRCLDSWLATGKLESMSTLVRLPNIIMTPLCVMVQIIAHDKYTSYNGANFPRSLNAKDGSPADLEVVGFCTGILAALVRSLSSGQADIESYGAIAIRLAMLAGAIVDADEIQSGGHNSLAASWKTEQDFMVLKDIISNVGAYISVRFDSNRVTITAPQEKFHGLLKGLNTAGITTMEIGLWGRFHTNHHQELLENLNRIIESNPSLRLPDACRLLLPCRADTSTTGEYITTGNLSQIALAAMLVQPSQWWKTYLLGVNTV